jgi:EAL domain-containing protein (putative c-di-GMP-specific phosphodiesterase class I)
MSKRLFKIWFHLKFLVKNRKKLYRESCKYLELNNVLKENSIDTYFQPILCLESGNTVGFEILNRPLKTTAFPNTEEFYDFIGKSGEVFSFEKFLRRLSFKRYSDQVHQQPIHKPKMIFINVHPQVLADPSYKTGETLEILAKHRFSPEQIVLELTEKEAVTDYDQFIKVIEHYKSQGFRIALDDAGTGYNSLKTILYVKPDFIKLDKSLIRNIHKQMTQHHLVKLLLDYADKSGTKVIAEGIETIEELFHLQQMGVHIGQGYQLGKPMPTLLDGLLPQYGLKNVSLLKSKLKTVK